MVNRYLLQCYQHLFTVLSAPFYSGGNILFGFYVVSERQSHSEVQGVISTEIRVCNGEMLP